MIAMSGPARDRARAAFVAVGLTTLACITSVTRVVRAAPSETGESPQFRLAYQSTLESCPNAPAFLGAIRARTERPRLAGPNEEAVTFGVTMSGEASGGVIGRLEIREIDGSRQERMVEGRSCAEVARALALVVALYLDPDAATGPEPERVPEPGPAAPSAPVAPRKEAPSLPATESAIRVAGGGALGGLGGVGPSIAPFLTAFLEATYRGRGPQSWLRPSARLGIELATTAAEVGPGSQRYLLAAGVARLCPVRVPLPERFRAAPCGGMMIGVHRGTSDGIPNARAQDRSWLTPATTLVVGFDVSHDVTIELEGGALFPLVRTRFFLGPNLTLFRAPPVAGTASAAVVVRFW
ncbi:MAG: Autotransporter [Labilithrix sp.]|nr:Autotransporter [Labilithrix sp.]